MISPARGEIEDYSSREDQAPDGIVTSRPACRRNAAKAEAWRISLARASALHVTPRLET